MFPKLKHYAIKISEKSRPCSWSTSSYALSRENGFQKLPNPSLHINALQEVWKDGSLEDVVNTPIRNGGRI